MSTRDPEPRTTQLRIARPVSNLNRSAAMYRDGLGLVELGRFENHEGFDGIMLGRPGLPYHLEFTYCRSHPVVPVTTPDDLLVFYLPEAEAWGDACAAMLRSGFLQVRSFNPYWEKLGKTFEDPDGYRVVLQQATWGG